MLRSTIRRAQGGSCRRKLGSSVLGVGAVSALVAGVALLGVPGAVASGGSSPYTTLSVAVGGESDGVAVDDTTGNVYVASGASTVSVIDEATDTVTATIPVGPDPQGVGVDASTGTVYVASGASNTVSVIDEATGTVVATPTVGIRPWGVGVDPSTGTVYVTNFGASTVSVIDEATDSVTATIPVGINPLGVGVDPSTGTAYVSSSSSDTVSVIVPATVKVSPTSGRPGASVSVSGQGFNPGETVKITYKTGLASPVSVTICSATAGWNSSFSCTGRIPPAATAGAHGVHTVAAKGRTSLIKVKTTFTLT